MTHRWVAQRALGDRLEQCRFANVSEADLLASLVAFTAWALSMEGVHQRTIPLFKLLPGRPRRTFFSSSFFLGGILLRSLGLEVAKVREPKVCRRVLGESGVSGRESAK